ncbi:hypothetical protein GCM10022416_28040 [Actinomadura keratinilytica]|jgi:hypothetical protein|uniref:Uncharacterized protein n=1 Tax=Actinomadura keratinilytica TaxID=547461 RepID=A0ABP7YSF4_9ACTN
MPAIYETFSSGAAPGVPARNAARSCEVRRPSPEYHRDVHWWIQQARDSAAEAQAADPSPENLMAAAQVEALASMAEALHRIASALEKQDGRERARLRGVDVG